MVKKEIQTFEIKGFFDKINVVCNHCEDIQRISAIPGGMKVYCEKCKKYFYVRTIRGEGWE